MNTKQNPEFELSLEDEDTEPRVAEALDEPFDDVSTDLDDLPVLTDVVDERVEPYIGESSPIILEPIEPEPEPIAATAPANLTPLPAHSTQLVAERLVALETAISRHIEDWMANELPQLLSRELDEFADRIRVQAIAHLRSTLLPHISADIAENLDDLEP